MTVGELKAKLELYKDDVEIFTSSYDDLMGTMHYGPPRLEIKEVDANKNRFGEWFYSEWAYRPNSKQHVILVIQ